MPQTMHDILDADPCPDLSDDMVATCDCGKRFHCSRTVYEAAKRGEHDMPECSLCTWLMASEPNR
jgi:hypothetical protein